MTTFYTDSALKIAARDKGVTCKADSGWNEYRITAPGVPVATVDRGHTKEDRTAARAEAWVIVLRMAAPTEEAAAVMAAAMRASVPALNAAAASLARRAPFDPVAARRLPLVLHVAELKARAVPHDLAAAFSLKVKPAAVAVAAVVALAVAGPAAADIEPGHFMPAAGTLESALESVRAYLAASPAAAVALCVGAAAAFATWIG